MPIPCAHRSPSSTNYSSALISCVPETWASAQHRPTTSVMAAAQQGARREKKNRERGSPLQIQSAADPGIRLPASRPHRCVASRRSGQAAPLRTRVPLLLPLSLRMLVLSHRRRRGSPAVPSRRSTGHACHRSYGCCLAQISSPPSCVLGCPLTVSLQRQTLAASVISLAPPFA